MALLDQMNLLKIIRWTINPQKYSGRICLGSIGQIRWQTTEVPPKEEPVADVSTKVTPVKQSNLMEFFDTSENLYEPKIIHGRFCFVRFFVRIENLNRTMVVFG
jgi:hypothetical protein